MNRPSETALTLGEALFDYVPYGMTRFIAVQELAEMVDESNRELLEAVRAVLLDAQGNGGVPAAIHVAHLQRAVSEYEPIAWTAEVQDELAGPPSGAVAGERNFHFAARSRSQHRFNPW
jgi:hypothetical protein